jgi:hypothetical protein
MGEKPTTIDAPRSRYMWLEDQPPDWSVYIEHALEPIAALRDLVAGWGAHVVVVACPAPWQVSADASNGEEVRAQAGVSHDALYRSHRPFEIIADYCRAHNIAYCDIATPFQRSDRPEHLYLKHAAALSPEGHALYARCVADFLSRGSLGPAPAAPGTARDSADQIPALPQARLPTR